MIGFLNYGRTQFLSALLLRTEPREGLSPDASTPTSAPEMPAGAKSQGVKSGSLQNFRVPGPQKYVKS